MRSRLTGFLLFISVASLNAQSGLLDSLSPEASAAAPAILFNGTRLINGHSVEVREKGILEFIISHRFGEISSGGYNLYGLDESNVRFALEYAPLNHVYLGIGRSSFEKTYDGFVKVQLMRQLPGRSPVALTLFASTAFKTLREPERDLTFSDRLTYTSQLLLGRKISQRISVQFMPTYIHFNTVREDEVRNDVWAFGIGSRIRLTRRLSLNGEYYYQKEKLSADYFNSFAVGVEIETGGHVFQLQLTNARAMLEKGFIAENTSDFFSGDIRLGFNISRAFQIGK